MIGALIGFAIGGLLGAVLASGSSSQTKSLRPALPRYNRTGDPVLDGIHDEHERLDAEIEELKQGLSDARPAADKLRRTRDELSARAAELDRAVRWLEIVLVLALMVGLAGLFLPFLNPTLAWTRAAGPLFVTAFSIWWFPAFSSTSRASTQAHEDEQKVAKELNLALTTIAGDERRLFECNETLRALESRFNQRKRELERTKQVNAARDEAEREENNDTAIIQGALLWWSTERLRADEFVAEHHRDLIASEKSLLSAYVNPNDPCSSMERCLSLARRAEPRMRHEIAYLHPGEQRSVEDIAVILRRRHGFAVEVLLPLARAVEREQRLVPQPDLRALAAAAQAAEELEAKRLAILREAGAWWQSEGHRYGDSAWLERHVLLHRRWILRQMDAARAAYQEGSSLTSSFESCQTLATWALEHHRAEVLYHFQNGTDGSVTVDCVAHALRRFHGRMVEVLIPLALDAREGTDSGAIFAKLEPEALKMFEAVQSVVQTEEVAKQLIQQEQLRLLRQEHVREDELEARLEPYRKIVLQAAAKFTRLKGFVR